MAPQHRGSITTWKDDKGFGFITPDDGGTPVFFHVSGLAQPRPRPSMNVVVRYTVIQDTQHRPQAIQVHIADPSRTALPMSVGVVSLFLFILILVASLLPQTRWVLVLYTISSSMTYGLYALDKTSARQGTWRIPEDVLHLLELAGGWPGALIAQAYYRHKTVKASYQTAFWLLVGSNLVVLIGYYGFQLFSEGRI